MNSLANPEVSVRLTAEELELILCMLEHTVSTIERLPFLRSEDASERSIQLKGLIQNLREQTMINVG